MKEEDIKILEERIDYFKCNPEGCNWRLSFEDEKDIQALENLIKGYRELEERIIFLTNLSCINDSDENYIPKSRIRKLLDIQYELFNSKNQKEYSQEVVNVLEELLEEE